jgi:hypothetical protein
MGEARFVAEPLPMDSFETCPRCGGTGVDPDPDGGTVNPLPPTVLLAHWSHFCSIGLCVRASRYSFRSYMLAVATAGAWVVYPMKRRPKPKPIAEPPRDPDVTDEEISHRMERGLRGFLSTLWQPHGKSPSDQTIRPQPAKRSRLRNAETPLSSHEKRKRRRADKRRGL